MSSNIEMARKNIAKVTRAEIRLKHSLLADMELNEVLPQRLAAFDKALQNGVLQTVSLELVEGEVDETD